MANFVPRHTQRGLQHRVHVDGGFVFIGGRARKNFHVADNESNPVRRLACIVEWLTDVRPQPLIQLFCRDVGWKFEFAAIQPFRDIVQIRDDGGERIVDLVCHTSGECPNGCHAITHDQMRFHLLPLGHVPNDAE